LLTLSNLFFWCNPPTSPPSRLPSFCGRSKLFSVEYQDSQASKSVSFSHSCSPPPPSCQQFSKKIAPSLSLFSCRAPRRLIWVVPPPLLAFDRLRIADGHTRTTFDFSPPFLLVCCARLSRQSMSICLKKSAPFYTLNV